MSRFSAFIFIAALLFLAGCHNGRAHKDSTPDDTTAVKQKGPAKFEFHDEIHNFGNLKAGEVVSFEAVSSCWFSGQLT